ncbi:MAG: DUF1573 domain-containing protein [Acidobacteria bacterium]|nr:DUF1573 domain-containing protein [Acidobacteriota bacterium]
MLRTWPLCFLLWFSASAQPAPVPSLRCEAAVWTFGTIPKGTRASHTFILENAGTAPLTISSVQPSCSCTTAQLSRQILLPGQTAEVDTQMDSTDFEGPLEKLVFVHSDDPSHPTLPLTLRAEVEHPYLLSPKAIRVQSMGRHAVIELPIRVTRKDGRPIPIREATLEGLPGFRLLSLPGPTSSERAYTLRYEGGAEPGLISGRALFKVEDPLLPTFQIPVQVRVLEDVSVYPGRLDLGDFQAGEAVVQPILVSLRSPSVGLHSVVCEPDLFSATLTTRVPLQASPFLLQNGVLQVNYSNGVEVKLRARPGAPAGAFEGRIILLTSSPGQARIVLPISGRITPTSPRPEAPHHTR